MVYRFELIALAVVFLLARIWPRRRRVGFRLPARLADWPARHPRAAVLVVGAAAFLFSFAVCRLSPLPLTHDGSSYLLAADTFARARVTNPPHPLWQHFETFHVLQQPTYQSKFPPAQGMMLALGQVLFSTPEAGIWLGFALACAATYWMLQAWLPPRWAFLGAWLPMLRIGAVDSEGWRTEMFAHWARGYDGGAVAMLGGALLYGGLRRVVAKPRVIDSLLLGAGIVILANSRPFEGLLVSLPAAALLAWECRPGWARTAAPQNSRPLTRIALPAALVIVAGAVSMTFYNYRVTGDPWLFPHTLHEQTYYAAPHFVWLDPRPAPEHRHQALREQHLDYQLQNYTYYRDHPRERIISLIAVGRVLAGPLLYPPLLLAPLFFRRKWTRLALIGFGLVCLGYLQIPTPSNPHYIAPAAPLLYLLAVEGLRRIHLSRHGILAWGRLYLPLLLAALVVSRLLSVGVFLREQNHAPSIDSDRRAAVVEELRSSPGQDLVIVRFNRTRPSRDVWVSNDADIDGSQIVWARETDQDGNRRLLDYFSARRAWLLEVGDGAQTLRPFPQLPGEFVSP